MKVKLLAYPFIFALALPAHGQLSLWNQWEPGQPTTYHKDGAILYMPEDWYLYHDTDWTRITEEQAADYLIAQWQESPEPDSFLAKTLETAAYTQNLYPLLTGKLADYNTQQYSSSQQYLEPVVSSTPEPETYLTLILGLLSLGYWKKRRAQVAKEKS